jgi:DNA-binding transcriptional regulator YdaS (Cro superfamily)
MTETPPTIKAIITKLGGPTKVAEHFTDLTPQAVSQWTRVPEERLARVAELTGISPAELRPDLAQRARMFAA